MTQTREVDRVSAAYMPSIGPDKIEDWLAQDPPPDGSRVELIMGYFHVVPPAGSRHQYVGDELQTVLRDALRVAGRTDLRVVTAVGVEISTALRTALIPDISVVNVRSFDPTFLPEQLELVVEIWSPGNPRSERETKKQAYAVADVMFFWAVDFSRDGLPTITAYRLFQGDFVVAEVAKPGEVTTITAAPVPVSLDPADLLG